MPPTFGQLKRYCERNGWELIRNTDHWYYEKVLPNGEVLRTRVSHAVSKEIPHQLWQRILKQLQTTEEGFWKSL
jgi:hypothetical protein